MSDEAISVEPQRTPRRWSDNILVMVAVAFGGHAIASADITFIAWLFSRVPAREMWVPYLALASSGLALSPFLYWARLVKEQQPKVAAIRFTIGIGCYAEAVAIASGFIAIRLGILAQQDVLESAPFVLSVIAIGTIPIVPATRRMLEKRHAPRSE